MQYSTVRQHVRSLRVNTADMVVMFRTMEVDSRKLGICMKNVQDQTNETVRKQQRNSTFRSDSPSLLQHRLFLFHAKAVRFQQFQ